MPSNTIRVRLRLFGPLKENAAADASRELSEGASVADLMALLLGEGVLPSNLLRASAVAVNQEYASLEQVLVNGDEVAVLPPVSGGLDED